MICHACVIYSSIFIYIITPYFEVPKTTVLEQKFAPESLAHWTLKIALHRALVVIPKVGVAKCFYFLFCVIFFGGAWMLQTQWLVVGRSPKNQSAILQATSCPSCIINALQLQQGEGIIAWMELEAVPWLQVASYQLPVTQLAVAGCWIAGLAVLLC